MTRHRDEKRNANEFDDLRQVIVLRQERRQIRRMWLQVVGLAIVTAALALGVWRIS